MEVIIMENKTTVKIGLHNDPAVFTLDLEGYDDNTLTEMMNNQQLTVVNIGGLILHRQSIKYVLPVKA
jgi:hypothetical protein